MTDRFNAFTVVLDRDIRDDDAQATIAAIEQLKGVIKVRGNVVGIDATVAEERVRQEIGRKLWEILYPSRRNP